MICFISGHLDLSEQEFSEHYAQPVLEAIQKGAEFVIGDCRGCDTIAQQFLHDQHVTNVTIYHMFDQPRNNRGHWKTIGGFRFDAERDAGMTRASNCDILWVRSREEQQYRLGSKFNPKRISGTEQNRLRREKMSIKI